MKANFWSHPFEIKLGGEGNVPERIQILRVGTFKDKRYGTFKITPEILLSLKKNFDGNVLGVDVAIDYAHDNESVAAGWIKSLELTENNTQLWADVTWTPAGTQKLSSKEFRYLSAEIAGDYEHNESLKKFGPTLKGAGLTNRPVIKGMAPVMELSDNERKIEMEEKEKEIVALKERVTALEGDNAAKDAKLSEQDGKIAEFVKKEEQLAEEAKKAEKKGSFDKMLSEGKVVEAQRDAFMSGDTMKFAELAQPINLKPTGTETNPKTTDGDVQDQIVKLAEEKIAKKECVDLGDAIQAVLRENDELRKKYSEA